MFADRSAAPRAVRGAHHDRGMHELLATLDALCRAADARAAHPPRIGPEAWRGPASRAYLVAASAVEVELRGVAHGLADARSLARAELARGAV